MAETYTVQVSTTPDDAERAFVLEHLIAYNTSQSHALLASRAMGRQPLHVLLRAADGTPMGGLIGYTIWNWLDIDLFWLDDRVRGQDFGTQIIRAAEAEAARRGCQHSKVGTFSFQARGFYEKMGYHVVGQIDDFPPGASDYILVKDLA
jgi:GNAT superfamily N-acetyltransferase